MVNNLALQYLLIQSSRGNGLCASVAGSVSATVPHQTIAVPVHNATRRYTSKCLTLQTKAKLGTNFNADSLSHSIMV